MVSVWLIILAVIVPVLVLTLSFYILVYFQHPEDRSTSYVSKTVVVLGLSLAMITVLMVPFDVANQGGQFGCGVFSNDCGGLSGINWIWMILFLIIGFFIFILIPFTVFFYESFDFENKSTCRACWTASAYQVYMTIIGVGILVVCYIFLRETALPVEEYDNPTTWIPCPTEGCDSIILTDGQLSGSQPAHSGELITFGTPFLVFLPGFLGFIGWFLFSLYAGIGLIALPIELVRSFFNRPKYMPRDHYLKIKVDIQKRTMELLDAGDKLRLEMKQEEGTSSLNVAGFSRNRKQRKLFNEFKQNVIELEEDYQELKLCHENWVAYNPLIPWCKLVVGILSGIISLLWILHIVLYSLARTPYGPDGVPTLYFLNVMFSAASKKISFALLGTVLVGVFTFYLLFATMKGNQKFGMRFFLIEIHPMKYNGTYMNSFLVNTSLILFTIPPLIQFVSSALSEYIVLTDLDAIFGQQITFLLFFQVFYKNNVFIIIMLSVAFITLFVMVCITSTAQRKQSVRLAERIAQLNGESTVQDKYSKKAGDIARSARSQPNLADTSSSSDNLFRNSSGAPRPSENEGAMAQI